MSCEKHDPVGGVAVRLIFEIAHPLVDVDTRPDLNEFRTTRPRDVDISCGIVAPLITELRGVALGAVP